MVAVVNVEAILKRHSRDIQKKLPAAHMHHRELLKTYDFQLLVTCNFSLATSYFPPFAAAITASETLAGGGA